MTMRKTNELPARGRIYAATAIIVVLAIGLATITHADDKRERGERSEHEGRGAIANITAKLNLFQDLKVTISDDSDVRVHGAKVTATSTSGFTATSATPPLTFNVQTDASTKFNIRGFGNGTLANIVVGDTVNFRGTALSGTTTSTWTVKATHVEDKTAHPKPPKSPTVSGQVNIHGTVQSVSTTANTFVVTSRKGTTTVSVSGQTVIRDEEKNALQLSGVTVGSEVKVLGTFGTSASVLAATRVTVDLDEEDDRPTIKNLQSVITRLEALIDWLKGFQMK